jgi:hypothetical protein
MVQIFNEKMTKEQIVQSPKDCVLDGVITSIEKGLFSEFLDEKVHDKFDNLERPTLNLKFECKFQDRTVKGNESIAYYEEPMSNSILGKFLDKYSELKAGQVIKVDYNGKGFGSIKVD